MDALNRSPLLIEAIKGGMGGDEHEIYAHIRSPQGRERLYQTIRLTHDEKGRKVTNLGDALHKHIDTFHENPNSNVLTIAVLRKGKPGQEHTRFRPDGRPHRHQQIAEIDVTHTGETHPETGHHVVVPAFMGTQSGYRRKGWASTLFDHAHRALKKHGLHLQHDPAGQTHMGRRWASRQETARGGFEPRHRKIQKGFAPALSMSPAAYRMLGAHRDLFPHHEKISRIANKILDQGGGYYSRKHTSILRRTAAKLGVPRELLTYQKARQILDLHGGEEQ